MGWLIGLQYNAHNRDAHYKSADAVSAAWADHRPSGKIWLRQAGGELSRTGSKGNNPETTPAGFLFRSNSVGGWASKEDEILIWIRHNKSSGAPRFLLQWLIEADSCSLISQKQLFDFVRGADRDRRGEQMFALANIASKHRFTDQPQVESCIVADDLPVERRIAIDELQPRSRACLYRNRRNS